METGKNILGNYGDLVFKVLDREREITHDDPNWKEKGRAKFKELLLMPETGKDIRARVIERKNYDGLTIEEIAWQLPYGPETRAFLLKPEGVTEPLPGVLALHDHGGFKYFGKEKITRTSESQHPLLRAHQENAYSGRAWANELAKRGFAVLVHDTFAFGSRRVDFGRLPADTIENMMHDPMDLEEPDPGEKQPTASRDADLPGIDSTSKNVKLYNAYARQHEHLIAKSLFSAGYTWPGLFLSDDMAALDYLSSREDVDEERIGCGGLSGGGLRTDFLAGLDDRIKCSVTVGFMTTWKDFALNVSYKHTWMTYVPGLPVYLDFPEILGLRAPLPTMVMATYSDPLYTLDEVRQAESQLRKIFEKEGHSNQHGNQGHDKAGHSDRLDFRYYDGPHYFNSEMQEDAFSWFERWLKG